MFKQQRKKELLQNKNWQHLDLNMNLSNQRAENAAFRYFTLFDTQVPENVFGIKLVTDYIF